MIAASEPVQRPAGARLLVVDSSGAINHTRRTSLIAHLRPGDLVVANDAATLPASLAGVHVPTGEPIELRLAGRRTLRPNDLYAFTGVVFGAGDFHTRTEDRLPPPRLTTGDRLALGPLSATIDRVLDHPRLVCVRFAGAPDAIWSGIASHGRPIQYAHVPQPLALWDAWTPIAGPPAAFEPPSAGFALDWSVIGAMRAQGVVFATLTHAAGISSTGDAALDARLPFDEAYRIPASTTRALCQARTRGGRVIAVGTTVVRALEAAGRRGRVPRGEGLATGRLGPHTWLSVVDAILSGTHEPASSHYELLSAFAGERTMRHVTRELETHAYRTHEFGDSVLVENRHPARRAAAAREDRRTARYCFAPDGPTVGTVLNDFEPARFQAS